MDRFPSIVNVGIQTAPIITVSLHSQWRQEGATTVADTTLHLTSPAEFTPLRPDCTFTLHNVTIGKTYHWEREEEQTFTGKLRIIREDGQLTAVNTLPIEDYLVSVISSEMSATASLEFLKASAVISRSWVIKQIIKNPVPALYTKNEVKSTPYKESREGIIISWQDHEDHALYDVCADDHCQRYQGITRATNPNVQLAVNETRGEVLTYQDEVCDCRFSKCCGGKTEEFSTCWQDTDVPYLQALDDRDPKDGTILCDTRDRAILAQVLNDYDQETADFYRWTVVYTQAELRSLLRRKLGRDLGDILELRPLKRGKSGRICELEIIGTKDRLTIGKELTIRSALSESHLYSSAFEVEASYTHAIPHRGMASCPPPGGYRGLPPAGGLQGTPSLFILRGRGWGHGVGLCQIGAAVMGAKGYSYREILAHYYPETKIENSEQ